MTLYAFTGVQLSADGIAIVPTSVPIPPNYPIVWHWTNRADWIQKAQESSLTFKQI